MEQRLGETKQTSREFLDYNLEETLHSLKRVSLP